MKRLGSLLPFASWLEAVDNKTLRADALAGLTGAILVVPQGVAFAAIAGLPPEFGLYSAIAPTIIAALFGSSHHLVTGPTTAISIVVFANLSPLAEPFTDSYVAMALGLTLLSGLTQLSLGLARLGAIAGFISTSVMAGFTAGAAIHIAVSQLGAILGVSAPRQPILISQVAEIAKLAPQANLMAVLLAGFALAAALAVKLARPRWPGMLLALASASFLAQFLDASGAGVRFVAPFPGTLPPLSLPRITIQDMQDLVPGALAVAMLGLAEAVTISRSLANITHQRIDNSREFLGQGLANIAGSFFSAYAASGSFTRSGVNFAAGAKTPLASVFAAVFLSILTILTGPAVGYLPVPAMAGVIVLAAYQLVEFGHISKIVRTSREETVVMAVTFGASLLLHLEFALFAGVLLSLLTYLRRTSKPHFTVLAPDTSQGRRLVNAEGRDLVECPQLKILRLDGSIFFGAVNHVAEELRRFAETFDTQDHILIVGSGVNFIDVSGAEMLFHEDAELVLSGKHLYVSSLKSDSMEALRKGECLIHPGDTRFFPSKSDALREIVPRLDRERCRACNFRVFAECSCMPAPEGVEPEPS
jgi:sulfate permease, SulP family